MSPPHDLVIVDVETSGLDPRVHVPVEIGWFDTRTRECGWFVPFHTEDDLARADPAALQVNGYHARLAPLRPRSEAAILAARTEMDELQDRLHGARLAGANPAFDAAFLSAAFARHDPAAARAAGAVLPWRHRLLIALGQRIGLRARLVEKQPLGSVAPWHHRLLDVEAYVAGHLSIDPRELPGLAGCARALDIPVPPTPHRALTDVAVAAQCLQAVTMLTGAPLTDLPAALLDELAERT